MTTQKKPLPFDSAEDWVPPIVSALPDHRNQRSVTPEAGGGSQRVILTQSRDLTKSILLRVPEAVHTALKVRAAAERTSVQQLLTQMITDALG
jgi:hypothetical protein